MCFSDLSLDMRELQGQEGGLYAQHGTTDELNHLFDLFSAETGMQPGSVVSATEVWGDLGKSRAGNCGGGLL